MQHSERVLAGLDLMKHFSDSGTCLSDFELQNLVQSELKYLSFVWQQQHKAVKEVRCNVQFSSILINLTFFILLIILRPGNDNLGKLFSVVFLTFIVGTFVYILQPISVFK